MNESLTFDCANVGVYERMPLLKYLCEKLTSHVHEPFKIYIKVLLVKTDMKIVKVHILNSLLHVK